METTTRTRNLRLLQRFTLRSPLSHIGESESTTSFLVEEPILQPDESVARVFCYSGNAWRGQLRDLMATYLLQRLGNPVISLDAFHLLFSGGAIGGQQQTDLGVARAYRRLLPMLALLGGGIGNQVLPGKMRVSNAYPVCVEALPAIDPFHRLTTTVSYAALTFEKSFSRKDDAKDPAYLPYLAQSAPALTQGALLPSDESKPARGDAPAQQMRMTVELLAAGTQLLAHIDLLDVTDVELGCLVSGLHTFSRSPHIGGQANRGHGLVTLETVLGDLDTGEVVPEFVTVADRCLLSLPAASAKDAYDQHLRGIYDAMLDANQPEIRRMIGAGA
jgi:hypothetical protein